MVSVTGGVLVRPAAAATDATFTYTGTDATATVPAGVCTATFDVTGGSGGSGGSSGYPGGKGGHVVVTVTTTAGTVYGIRVGGAGQSTNAPENSGGRSGSSSNGGDGEGDSGGGGGASMVLEGGVPTIIAGGGGGGSGAASANAGGGPGGNAGMIGSAGAGDNEGTDGAAAGGGGATASAVGTGGQPASAAMGGNQGSNGYNGKGGDGASEFHGTSPSTTGGGGGGGGYFGGGGGGSQGAAGGSGGGGSNLAPSGAVTNGTATGSGDGAIAVTFGDCPAPAPASVNATAGTSSIVATWPASSTGNVTGYTAVASPGPATCETSGALTCVLGATAGVTYTVTVIAHSTGGDSPPSPASGPVTPTAPIPPAAPPATNLVLTTDRGHINTAAPGQQITFIGTGFAAHSTVVISVYSAATVLGTATTDATGNFSKPITLPTGLTAGPHTATAQGVAPDGTPRAMNLALVVPANPSPAAGAPATRHRLPVTGIPTGPAMLLGVLALLIGVVLRRAGRPTAA